VKIERLRKAIKIVADPERELSVRQVTYLRTYPVLRDLGKIQKASPTERFLQLAVAAYGWMPRVVRVDADKLAAAADAVAKAADAKLAAQIIEAVADCLYSVVGASKVLHFVSPEVYPIWDSNVQRFWGYPAPPPTPPFMREPKKYLSYAEDIHSLLDTEAAQAFCDEFRAAHAARLQRLEIGPYHINDVRVLESAAFELSNAGEYEDD
jgi:hypothetical protein